MRGLYFYSMDAWEDLLQQEVQHYILENEKADAHTLALGHKTVKNIPVRWIAAQIVGRQKAKAKLPLYYTTRNIVYPPSLNLEQSSSQATALYKKEILSSLLPGEISVSDLTGGFGIDSFFLSQAASSLIHVEPNVELQKIAAHNHRQVGATNITYVNQKAEDFIGTLQKNMDVCYVDPSRRKEGQKVFSLADGEPNMETLQEVIFTKSNHLLVKAAPLLDIQHALKSLRFVKRVIVVSVENECKELLFWCEKGFSDEPEIQAVNLMNTGVVLSSYTFTFTQEQETLLTFGLPKEYLYEPNASILKAGAFKSIALSFPVEKLATSTHLYTADKLVNDFPGRIFKLISLVKADVKSIHALLPDKKANVLTRNYPLKAEELKKKLKLNDGGEHYLLGFSGPQSKYLALCLREK